MLYAKNPKFLGASSPEISKQPAVPPVKVELIAHCSRKNALRKIFFYENFRNEEGDQKSCFFADSFMNGPLC